MISFTFLSPLSFHSLSPPFPLSLLPRLALTQAWNPLLRCGALWCCVACCGVTLCGAPWAGEAVARERGDGPQPNHVHHPARAAGHAGPRDAPPPGPRCRRRARVRAERPALMMGQLDTVLYKQYCTWPCAAPPPGPRCRRLPVSAQDDPTLISCSSRASLILNNSTVCGPAPPPGPGCCRRSCVRPQRPALKTPSKARTAQTVLCVAMRCATARPWRPPPCRVSAHNDLP